MVLKESESESIRVTASQMAVTSHIASTMGHDGVKTDKISKIGRY